MKEIVFRPLRRVKKTGKIVVASYSGWRNVMTADYNKFLLVVNDGYKKMTPDAHVYDHNGNLLFFFTYNPADIPVYDYSTIMPSIEEMVERHGYFYGIRWSSSDGHVNYNARGMDCDGVPTFSHWDEDRVTQEDTWKYYGPDQFEPLTVRTVVKWLGWFLYQLNNSYLQIGK